MYMMCVLGNGLSDPVFAAATKYTKQPNKYTCGAGSPKAYRGAAAQARPRPTGGLRPRLAQGLHGGCGPGSPKAYMGAVAQARPRPTWGLRSPGSPKAYMGAAAQARPRPTWGLRPRLAQGLHRGCSPGSPKAYMGAAAQARPRPT